MKFDKVLIFAPNFEQRVSKLAYSFVKRGIQTVVCAEEAIVAREFDNYTTGVDFIKIPVNETLKRTPLGRKRASFVCGILMKHLIEGKKVLVLSRDVTYGYLIGRLLKNFKKEMFYFITDIADNYDLFYDSVVNPFKRVLFRIGFGVLTKKALEYSDAIFIVAKINKCRMRRKFSKELKNKPIFLLRNLPIHIKRITNPNKIANSLVYLGKIDEISRDPFFVLENLISMPGYTVHFYSEQKQATLDKIRSFSKKNAIQDRVVIHQRVKYDDLVNEISQYQVGLVPHKRSLITDYTTPNKIYDYKNSGLVTVMSDCPSLVEENKEFNFGFVYSKNNNDFVETVKKAQNSSLIDENQIPEWDDEFEVSYNELLRK